MAKSSITGGNPAEPVHTRTTSDTAESQVVVLGTDGSDTVLDPAMLATQATAAAILAKILTAPATEAKQDAAATLLTAIDGHVDGLEGKDFATQTTLAAVLAKLIAAPATEAKQDTANTALASILTSVDGLEGFTDGIEALLAAATPAGTNLIGFVDLAAATATAITDTAAITATKYLGVSVSETTNAATAKVRVRNNNVSGAILDTITLIANESVSYTYPRGRAAASGTVYLQVVSGAVEGSVFTA